MSRRSIYKSPDGEAEILALYDEALALLGVDCESMTLETHFGATHVLATGPADAPPLVVLPGGNFLNLTCLALFLPLAREYRIYAPDIVGQPGKSDQIRPSSKGDGHALWLSGVLNVLGLERAAFAGLSYGAGIILRLSGYAPERISKAVLVSPSGLVAGPILWMMREVVVPMFLYRLFPSRERLLRAATPILTEPVRTKDLLSSRETASCSYAVRTLVRTLPLLWALYPVPRMLRTPLRRLPADLRYPRRATFRLGWAVEVRAEVKHDVVRDGRLFPAPVSPTARPAPVVPGAPRPFSAGPRRSLFSSMRSPF